MTTQQAIQIIELDARIEQLIIVMSYSMDIRIRILLEKELEFLKSQKLKIYGSSTNDIKLRRAG